MYSNYKSIVFRIMLCFFLLCMTVGCRKEKNAYGYYYINESDEIVSPFYDYDYDRPSPFYDKDIARIEKKENALDEERDVYFIDREFNIIGDSFFSKNMIETGVYEGKPVFISGTEKGIDILDENMSIISSIPYEMEGVEQIESIISPPGNNGLLALKDSETGKWGYVSIEGKLMIDYSYQVAQIFTVDGIAIVEAENGLYGAIDEKGEYVIEPQYNCMTNFSNGRSFAQISKGGEGILIDLEGNKLSDNKFCFSSFPDVVDIYIDGLACVQDYKTKLYGYIDDYGDYVIEPQFIAANYFVNGYATVTGSNGLRGIINDKGEEVVPCQYEDMTFLSEDGVVKIRKDGLDGYYSIDKGWIIEPKYKDATGFFNGYAIIKVNETIKQ